MSRYLLTFLSSGLYKDPTGVKLASLCDFTPINNFRSLEDPNILVRYGLTCYPNADLLFNKVFNKADDLKYTVNKLIFSRYLLSHGYKATPKIWTDKNLIERSDLPVLGRMKKHTRGLDIKFISSIRQLRRDHSDYYVKFIKSRSEYRVHIFNRKPIRIQKKILKDPNMEESIIKNVDHGYILVDHYNHDLEIEEKILEEAITVMNIMALDFGALDFIVSEEGDPYVLEINTAPRLNKYGRQLYAYYILQAIGEERAIESFSRLRLNEGPFFNGLDIIEFRDIVKRDGSNIYE